MSYCADIARTGKVMQTGSHRDTVEASLADALDCATSESGYAHHEHLRITVFHLCETCKGAGTIYTKRHPFAGRPCKACKGQAATPVLEAQVRNPKTEALP